MYIDDPNAVKEMKSVWTTILACILISVVVSAFGYSILRLNVITCAALAGLLNGWASIYILPWAREKYTK